MKRLLMTTAALALAGCGGVSADPPSSDSPTSSDPGPALSWDIPGDVVVTAPGVTTTVSLVPDGLVFDTEFGHGMRRTTDPIPVSQAKLDEIGRWWSLPPEDPKCSADAMELTPWNDESYCLENQVIIYELTQIAKDHPEAFPSWFSLTYDPDFAVAAYELAGPPPPPEPMNQELRINGPRFDGRLRAHVMSEEHMGRLYWNLTELLMYEPSDSCSADDSATITISDFTDEVYSHTFDVCDSADPSQVAFMEIYGLLEEVLTSPEQTVPLSWDLPAEGVTLRTGQFTTTITVENDSLVMTHAAPGRDPIVTTAEASQTSVEDMAENWGDGGTCEDDERTYMPWEDSECEASPAFMHSFENATTYVTAARPVDLTISYRHADDSQYRITLPRVKTGSKAGPVDPAVYGDYLWAAALLVSDPENNPTCEDPTGRLSLTGTNEYVSVEAQVCEGTTPQHEAARIISDIATTTPIEDIP